MNISAKIIRWEKLSAALKKVKMDEAELRREICDAIFAGRQGEFTETYVTETFRVKAKSRVTIDLDPEVYENIKDQLGADEEDAIKIKRSIIKKAYNALPKDSILHDAITIKPAMPALDVKRLS